jgi:signal transduction histidine kinase
MICIFEGPAHTFRFVNPPYQALVGERPLLDKPIAEAMPELAGQPIFGLLDHVYQTGETFTASEMLVQLDHRNEGRPELEKRYYNFIYKARHNRQGTVDGILVFAYEVTPQVLARQQVQNLNEELAAINEELRATNEEYQLANIALGESQQQLQQLTQELEARVQGRTRTLQSLFGQAPMALVVLRGPQFLIEQANAQAEVIWGVTVAEVLGRPHFEAVPGSAGQGFEEMLTGILATGEAVVMREVPIELARDHTGQPNVGYYNVIFKPLFDEGQPQPSGIVVMWTETTDQVLARQQVQQLNDSLTVTNAQLTRTNVDLDTFVYTASHDLKAPITNIESIVLALRDTLPAQVQQDEILAHLLDLLDTTVARFRFTIGQLTDISRLQLAHTGPAEPVLLAQVVENVRLDLAPAIVAADTQLTVEVPAGLMVSFSPANLRSIVYNLLSNAIKYRAPHRPLQVLVRAEQMGATVVLTVQDNGLGMSELQQRQLFGLFQRLHTHVEGTGVGLYISKRLVENAGGTIAVHSQADAGAAFTVTFPA